MTRHDCLFRCAFAAADFGHFRIESSQALTKLIFAGAAFGL